MIKTITQAQKAGKILKSTAERLQSWLEGGFLPPWAADSIAELVKKNAWEELDNRFYKDLAFGTGGMRGATIGGIVTSAEKGESPSGDTPEHPAAGSTTVNDFNIVRATIGLYRYCEAYLLENRIYDKPKVVIAHDVRHFSRHFCELAASVWNRLGGLAMIFGGPRSTPQLSFTVRRLKATAGIVITASHNPPHDNGYKVYFGDGAQVVYPHAEGIIEEVFKVVLKETTPHLEKDLDGVMEIGIEAEEAYLQALGENVLDREVFSKAKPKIVFTPIHGTAGVMTAPLLQRFGADFEVVEEQAVMDPRFPTVKSPNPENAEALTMAIAQARKNGADLVLATDPDSDRMGAAVRTKTGGMELLTGNMIGALLAEYRITKMKELGWLPEKGSRRAAIIKTFVTTPLQDAIGRAHGIKVVNTLTGFKWIGEKLKLYEDALKEKLLAKKGLALDYDATRADQRRALMLKHGVFYVFGGEESYGFLASDRVRDKDANAAVLMFCELAAALKKESKTFGEYLGELYLKYGYYQEALLNIYMEGAAGAAKIKKILDAYRKKPPREIAGRAVTAFRDFGKRKFKDPDGKAIPKENFYFLELEDGYACAVRGSGTEPKIKFYIHAREDAPDAAQLPAAKERAKQKIASLKAALETGARQRAES